MTFDNAKNFNFVNPNDSTTFTCAGGVGGYLFVQSSFGVTADTANGVNMSRIYTFTNPISDGNGNNLYIYGLSNPPSGSITIQLTNAGSGSIGIASYNLVSENAQPEGTVITGYTNNGVNNTQAGSLASSVTTLSDGAWAIMFTRGGNNFPQTFTSGDGTVRCTGEFIAGDGCEAIIDSNGAVSPPGSQTLTATWSSGTGFISNVIMSITAQDEGMSQIMIL